LLAGNFGGFTLRLWEFEGADNLYRPRIFTKKLAPGRTLIRFTAPAVSDDEDISPVEAGKRKRYSFRGHFLDIHTLAFALTTHRHSLASACKTFSVEHGKVTTEEHGVITGDYIDYNRRDVEATFELALRVLAEFDRHPISPDYRGKSPGAAGARSALQATKAYSPASVGKAYLRSMGINPVLERQPDFPLDILGQCMAAFYGGRSECRIRNAAVPIVLLDFLSMYPTVNALMGNWALLTAQRIEREDATAEVRQLLASMTIERALCPQTWRDFCTLVRIIPRGDRLPVRAEYAPGSGYNIGINPLTADRPMFYMLPDVVAAVLLTGQVPDVVSAVRFVPHGRQSGMRPTLLRGEVRVNPESDDLFRLAIETRKSLGNHGELTSEARSSLSAFLKIFANSTGYGIFAEMQRHEMPLGERASVEVYADRAPFTSETVAPEKPGEYFFAPIAASITAAARCMLAILERLVTDAGGSYVFCDTDSMAIVSRETGGLVPCEGGMYRLPDERPAVLALSWAEVESIRARFGSLNPYDRAIVPGSVLQHVDDEATHSPLHLAAPGELRCVAISAKRYAIYRLQNERVALVDYGEGNDDDVSASAGSARIAKYSEHGLGTYLSPTDPTSTDQSWIRDGFWPAQIRHVEAGGPLMLPSWADRMAVRQLTVSTPVIARGLAQYNAGAKCKDRIRPFSFCLSVSVAPLCGCPPGVDPSSFHLIGRYERDARKWPRVDWWNLHPTLYRDREEAEAAYHDDQERRHAIREWERLRSRVMVQGGIRPTREFPARLIPPAVRNSGGLNPDRIAAALGFEGDGALIDYLGAAWEAKRDAEHRPSYQPSVRVEPPGARFRVTVSTESNAGFALPGRAQVRSIESVLREYSIHPEVKSIGSNGKPCRGLTVGVLAPRPVRVGLVRYIGKESNKLEEREAQLVRRMGDALTEYAVPLSADDSWPDVCAVLGAMPRHEVERVSALTGRSLRRVITGSQRPPREVRERLFMATAEYARNADGAGTLHALAVHIREGRKCAGCEAGLSNSRQQWCAECHKRNDTSYQQAKRDKAALTRLNRNQETVTQ
jgi:hypothetical protein